MENADWRRIRAVVEAFASSTLPWAYEFVWNDDGSKLTVDPGALSYASGDSLATEAMVASPTAGDGSQDAHMFGLATFDLGAVPTDAQEIENATLSAVQNTKSANFSGNPFGMGALQVEHVVSSQDAVTNRALSVLTAPALADLGVVFSMRCEGCTLCSCAANVDASTAVRADFDLRISRADRTQYRFVFEQPSLANKVPDWMTVELALNVTYLAP